MPILSYHRSIRLTTISNNSIPTINTGVSTLQISWMAICSGIYRDSFLWVLKTETWFVFSKDVTYAQTMQDGKACYVWYFKIDQAWPIEAWLYDTYWKNVWISFSSLFSLKTVSWIWSDYLVIKMPSSYITSIPLSDRIGVVSRTWSLIISPKPIIESSLRYEGDGKFSATRYDNLTINFDK